MPFHTIARLSAGTTALPEGSELMSIYSIDNATDSDSLKITSDATDDTKDIFVVTHEYAKLGALFDMHFAIPAGMSVITSGGRWIVTYWRAP